MQLQLVTSVKSGWLGGDTADYNTPYLSPGIVGAVFYGGKFYTNGYWDEGGNENGVVDVDTPALTTGGGFTHGWGLSGGIAVTANNSFVFSAVIQGNEGGNLYDFNPSCFPRYTTIDGVRTNYSWAGIQRKERSTMAPAVGFTGATGFSGAFYKVTEYIDSVGGVSTAINAQITGLACTDSLLYIADPYNTRILIIDPANLTTLGTLTAPADIGLLAVAKDGNLWTVTAGTVKKIDSSTGAVLATIGSVIGAIGAIGVLADGRLWVADHGINQQVVLFNNDGTENSRYGISGGVFATGINGSLSDPNRVLNVLGFDLTTSVSRILMKASSGTLCIATSHDENNNRAVLHRYFSGAFLDVPDLNPIQDKAYFPGFILSLNLSEPSGPKRQQLLGVTGDPHHYPHSIRTTSYGYNLYYRSFLDRNYVFVTDQINTFWSIFEVVKGSYIYRAAGMITSENSPAPNAPMGAFAIWRPSNDGSATPQSSEWTIAPADVRYSSMYPDSNGTLWFGLYNASDTHAYVGRIDCTGIDSFGNPIWNFSELVMEQAADLTLVAEPNSIRLVYDPDKDYMLLAGFNAANRFGGEQWGGFRVVYAYRSWKGIDGPRVQLWERSLPPIDNNTVARAPAVAGDMVMIGYIANSPLHLFDKATGEPLAVLTSSGQTGVNQTWIDSATGVRLYNIGTNTYYAVTEREIGGSALTFDITTVNGSQSTLTDDTAKDCSGWAVTKSRPEGLAGPPGPRPARLPRKRDIFEAAMAVGTISMSE